MQLIFLFSEWDLRLFFSKVYDVLDVVYFWLKGHLKLLKYFSFFSNFMVFASKTIALLN